MSMLKPGDIVINNNPKSERYSREAVVIGFTTILREKVVVQYPGDPLIGEGLISDYVKKELPFCCHCPECRHHCHGHH